jgi:hypothetical protein
MQAYHQYGVGSRPAFLIAVNISVFFIFLIFGVLSPLSTIFQLYHGECTLFCNLQSRARPHAVLVIGLHELLDPTT